MVSETEAVAEGLSILEQSQLPAPREQIAFYRDDRPVDGIYAELRLDRNEHGSYNATFVTAWVNRLTGENEENTETISSYLDCTFSDGDEVYCSRDQRPVDGALTEITVSLGDDERYDATVAHTYYDRINGQVVSETDVIAEGLTILPQLPF